MKILPVTYICNANSKLLQQYLTISNEVDSVDEDEYLETEEDADISFISRKVDEQLRRKKYNKNVIQKTTKDGGSNLMENDHCNHEGEDEEKAKNNTSLSSTMIKRRLRHKSSDIIILDETPIGDEKCTRNIEENSPAYEWFLPIDLHDFPPESIRVSWNDRLQCIVIQAKSTKIRMENDEVDFLMDHTNAITREHSFFKQIPLPQYVNILNLKCFLDISCAKLIIISSIRNPIINEEDLSMMLSSVRDLEDVVTSDEDKNHCRPKKLIQSNVYDEIYDAKDSDWYKISKNIKQHLKIIRSTVFGGRRGTMKRIYFTKDASSSNVIMDNQSTTMDDSEKVWFLNFQLALPREIIPADHAEKVDEIMSKIDVSILDLDTRKIEIIFSNKLKRNSDSSEVGTNKSDNESSTTIMKEQIDENGGYGVGFAISKIFSLPEHIMLETLNWNVKANLLNIKIQCKK